MLSTRCAVPGCSNDRTENGDKTFLPAPKQKAVRDEWFRVLGVPDTVEDGFICEDHFEVDDKSEGNAESDTSASPPHSDEEAEPEAEPVPTSLKRKSATESKLPFKKKMLSKHRDSNKDSAPDEVVQACYWNSSCPSSPVSNASESQERSEENSESAWSVREGPITVNDDSNGSCKLVIKSEPEDDGYENEHNGGHDYIVPNGILQGALKVEASPMELHEEKSKPFSVGHDSLKEYQQQVLPRPFLEVVDQPESSYRFRYKRESSKPHGPLKGHSSINKPPRHSHGPRVMLRNFQGNEAVIRAWLFCGNEISPHQLVAPPDSGGTELKYEPHDVRVTIENNFIASFDKLNILHVVCGELDYQKRYYSKKVFCMSQSYYPPPKLPPIEFAYVKDEVKRIEKDIARMYFEAFERTDDGYRKIAEIFSDDIKNKKSPKTNDLRILRQSHEDGSCRGNQQVLIFTEKLIKDVDVEFFEEDEEGEITWRCKASFKDTDIHKQVGISFWTPPYKDLHIKKPIPVFFRLVRKTDGAYSHTRTYRYMPADCPCNSPMATPLPKVPDDVYLKWPRRRECTSPEKIVSVKDAGVQANLASTDEAKTMRRLVPPINKFYQRNTNPIQLRLPDPNHQSNNKVVTKVGLDSILKMAITRTDSNSVVSNTTAICTVVASTNTSTKSTDRKVVQLPGNVVQREGKNFLKVHIPKYMLEGIQTQPDSNTSLTTTPEQKPQPEEP